MEDKISFDGELASAHAGSGFIASKKTNIKKSSRKVIGDSDMKEPAHRKPLFFCCEFMSLRNFR